MDTRTFFENFRYVAEAPNGTTLLRSLILHAATHGHFRLPQDAKVPASLLPATEYHTHSEVPVANIGHDLDKPLLPVPPEVQGAYPRSWTTGRLGSYIQLISGQHLSPSEQNGSGIGIPYLTGASDLGDHYPKVCRWTTSPKALAKRGDLVISVKGTIGKINEIDVPEVALGRQLMAVRAMGFTKDYLALVLSSYKSDFKQKSIGIAIPGINRDDIRQLVVGIPSTPEQAFIVTKVDELLALCDTLDVKLVALKKQTTILSGELSDQGLDHNSAHPRYAAISASAGRLTGRGRRRRAGGGRSTCASTCSNSAG